MVSWCVQPNLQAFRSERSVKIMAETIDDCSARSKMAFMHVQTRIEHDRLAVLVLLGVLARTLPPAPHALL